MSTVIIGGGDNIRANLAEVETASLGWTQQQRDDAEALLGAIASCLKSVAYDGDASLFEITGP
jgi:hypothetical protein